MKYHWSDKNKLEKDNKYLTNLYEKYLIYISNILNKFHNESKDIRYWRIIVGPWLRFFIDIVFDRYETLNYDEKFKPKKINLNFARDILLRSNDFSSFINESYKDNWNKNLLNLIRGIDNELISFKSELTPKIKLTKVRFLLLFIYVNLINPLNRIINKNILIIDPYVKLRPLLKFIFIAKIIPYITKTRFLKGSHKWNKFIINVPKFKSKTSFEEILNTLILIYIPAIYTDYFFEFKKSVLRDLKYLPKIIFTSVGYQSNEECKLIAAETTSTGGKFLIAQHGGGMGIYKHNQSEKHQIEISDKYYSYGWRESGRKNIIPMPSLQLSTFDYVKPKHNGYLINIMASLPKYFYCLYSVPIGPEYLAYIDLQKKLSILLKEDISNRLIHRLNDDNYGWDANSLLKERGLKTCNYSKPLKQQLNKSSLCISSSNGTAGLQILSINFPTILYWPKNLFQIRKHSSYFFNNLADVGIYHTTPESAATHLNNVIKDVDSWWNDISVQNARKKFLANFGSTSKEWVKAWKAELLIQSKSIQKD
ncbi:LIC12162 family protein [Prochlorococcus sp. AH-716-O10]|nr:LIC12162 family protein [Prochlorococcus sp. AH-716-O10]